MTIGRSKPDDAASGERLQRRLGYFETTAIAIGAMVGGGVYVSLGQAAQEAGGSLVLAVVIGAAVATCNGLSAAELGANDPQAGGAYQFARKLVSPLVGFLAGWIFLFASLVAGATYALAFSAYLGTLIPGVPPRMTGVALVAIAVAINALGIRVTALANMVLVACNLLVLLVFVALAAPHFSVEHLRPFFANGASGVLGASALLFFAYTGYARPVTMAEEVEDPGLTLPRAVSTALALVTLLYLGVATAALGAVGSQPLEQQSAPLRAVMVATGSSVGPLLISVGALLATSVVLLTEILGISRLAFAMARNGDLSPSLGRVSDKKRIPLNAVMACGVVLLALAASLDLRPALQASSMALLLYYGVMNLCALRLPPERRLVPAIVSVCGLGSCLLLAFSLPLRTLAVVGCVALAGCLYHAIERRRR